MEKQKCDLCTGLGYTAEHDTSSLDENGDHDCRGCPVQVQCEKCEATGFLTPNY